MKGTTMQRIHVRGIALIAALVVSLGLMTGCDTMDSSGKHAYTQKAQHQKGTKTKAAQPASNLTPAQKNAVGAAQDYLSSQHFSRQGLIDQLSSKYGSQFKKPLAIWAVNHIKVDWNQQAVGAAKDYLSSQHFSRDGLLAQLSSAYGGKFTKAQALYGVNHTGL